MTFQYNAFADVMVVSISEPSSLCVYVESQTPGVILRIEESVGIVRGFEVLVWSRRIAKGLVLIPEVTDPEFQAQWMKNQSLMHQVE
jgi:hypothetical protein